MLSRTSLSFITYTHVVPRCVNRVRGPLGGFWDIGISAAEQTAFTVDPTSSDMLCNQSLSVFSHSSGFLSVVCDSPNHPHTQWSTAVGTLGLVPDRSHLRTRQHSLLCFITTGFRQPVIKYVKIDRQRRFTNA